MGVPSAYVRLDEIDRAGVRRRRVPVHVLACRTGGKFTANDDERGEGTGDLDLDLTFRGGRLGDPELRLASCARAGDGRRG